MQEVIIIEKTNHKELEKSINDTLNYLEENADNYIGLVNVSYRTAVIRDENGDDVIYYSALLIIDYNDASFDESEQENVTGKFLDNQ